MVLNQAKAETDKAKVNALDALAAGGTLAAKAFHASRGNVDAAADIALTAAAKDAERIMAPAGSIEANAGTIRAPVDRALSYIDSAATSTEQSNARQTKLHSDYMDEAAAALPIIQAAADRQIGFAKAAWEEQKRREDAQRAKEEGDTAKADALWAQIMGALNPQAPAEGADLSQVPFVGSAIGALNGQAPPAPPATGSLAQVPIVGPALGALGDLRAAGPAPTPGVGNGVLFGAAGRNLGGPTMPGVAAPFDPTPVAAADLRTGGATPGIAARTLGGPAVVADPLRSAAADALAPPPARLPASQFSAYRPGATPRPSPAQRQTATRGVAAAPETAARGTGPTTLGALEASLLDTIAVGDNAWMADPTLRAVYKSLYGDANGVIGALDALDLADDEPDPSERVADERARLDLQAMAESGGRYTTWKDYQKAQNPEAGDNQERATVGQPYRFAEAATRAGYKPDSTLMQTTREHPAFGAAVEEYQFYLQGRTLKGEAREVYLDDAAKAAQEAGDVRAIAKIREELAVEFDQARLGDIDQLVKKKLTSGFGHDFPAVRKVAREMFEPAWLY